MDRASIKASIKRHHKAVAALRQKDLKVANLSLRDYFAAAALTGRIVQSLATWNTVKGHQCLADLAYRDADAMLCHKSILEGARLLQEADRERRVREFKAKATQGTGGR